MDLMERLHADVEAELEGLETIGDVTVAREDERQSDVQVPSDETATQMDILHPQAYHAIRWIVTFESEEGDLPSLLVATSSGGQRGTVASGHDTWYR